METVILLVVVVMILAYYGLTKSLEKGFVMANKEVTFLSNVHDVSLIERTAKLGNRIDDQTIAEASEVHAKLKAMSSMYN